MVVVPALPMSLIALPLPTAALGVFCLSLGFILVRLIYRLLWHPLASFPGPRRAAITTWYRAYYDIILDGEWVYHLESLHEKYGPVVRVGPNELHFSHQQAYADIYSNPTLVKNGLLYKCFGSSLSVFGLVDFHMAQRRRVALGPLFSRRAIFKLEGELQKHVDKLVDHLGAYEETGQLADIHLAFRSVALDIITSYCFSKCFNALDAPHFSHHVPVTMDLTLHVSWVMKHFPFLRSLVDSTSERIGTMLMPGTKGYFDQANQLGAQIDEIMQDPSILQNSPHETMYHHMIANSEKNKAGLPQLNREWLLHEGLNLRFAGSETLGNSTTTGAFHILRDEHIKQTLMQELEEAWPDVNAPFGLEQLEKLPYLTAVLKESLRLSWGTVTPMERVVGPQGTTIIGVQIPGGTVVAMGHTFMHTNPEIFPDPFRFDPDRWLQGEKSAALDKYMVAFSKGPRGCLGVNLAWAELYIIMGNVFRKLDLTEKGTSLEDLHFREYFIPLFRGNHLKARVRKRK